SCFPPGRYRGMPKASSIATDDALPEILELSSEEAPVEIASGNGEISVTDAKKRAEEAAKAIEAIAKKYGDESGWILYPTIEYQGRTVDFICNNLSKLKGPDYRAIEREFKARFKPKPDESVFLNTNYLILLWARINDLDEGFFDIIDGTIYQQITQFYKMG